MKMDIFFRNLLFFSLILSISCSKKGDSNEKSESIQFNYEVERAPEWTTVFKRDSGWFGGDGIFTIPYYPDDKAQKPDSVLFVFSDTMVGEIRDSDSLQPGYKMVHNSYAILTESNTPESLRFYVTSDSKGESISTYKPKEDTLKNYYWLGDGFESPSRNGDTYLFAYPIVDTYPDSIFPFDQVGNDLLLVDNKYKTKKQLKIPFYKNVGDSLNISFGSGIYRNDSLVYIYGTRGVGGASKELIAARASIYDIENFSNWEFRVEGGWTQDYTEADALADAVANELSVSRLDNGYYALIYQEGGIYPKIYMRLSKNPYGPFGEKKLVWDTTNDIQDPDLYTYNAKAHPAISKPGQLIVTYNVNSFKFFDIIEDKPHLYRPRFVRIIYDK